MGGDRANVSFVRNQREDARSQQAGGPRTQTKPDRSNSILSCAWAIRWALLVHRFAGSGRCPSTNFTDVTGVYVPYIVRNEKFYPVSCDTGNDHVGPPLVVWEGDDHAARKQRGKRTPDRGKDIANGLFRLWNCYVSKMLNGGRPPWRPNEFKKLKIHVFFTFTRKKYTYTWGHNVHVCEFS